MSYNDSGPIGLEHVVRDCPPWRDEKSLTECGLSVGSYLIISRDDLLAKVTKQGKQRAALSTCMTCWGTAERHSTWALRPSAVLARECKPDLGPGHVGRPSQQIDRELRAIALLIEAHKDEFDSLLAALAAAVPLHETARSIRAKRSDIGQNRL